MARINDFQFPLMSTWHYINYDGVTNGPSSSDFLLNDITSKIRVKHIVELTEGLGKPKKISIPLVPYIREYHVKNNRFRLILDHNDIRTDSKQLEIFNYSLVVRAYRYQRNIFSEYYRWYNVQKTAFENAINIAKRSEENQFFFINAPRVIPSLQRLEYFSTTFNQDFLVKMSSYEDWFLLELWKWLGAETRKDSLIGFASKDELKRINIVFQESGRFTVLNLGKIAEWMKEDPDNKIAFSEIDLKKRVLRFVMSVVEVRTVITDTQIPEDIKEHPDLTATQINEVDTAKDEVKSLEENLDADLDQIRHLEAEQESVEKTTATQERSINSTDVDISKFDIAITPFDRIKATCDKFADEGLMSAAEYKRFNAQMENFKTLQAPSSTESLKDYVVIKPEVLKITETSKVPDNEAVLDKSMLESSLLDIDKRYIKDVLDKDIAGALVSSQNAGFVITKYEKETVTDILGSYDTHTLRITPVEGAPSTLRFTIPSVNDSGEYKIGGTKYRLRKQRGDMPIRKLSPSNVGLTSYYGKTFVFRNEKKVNNYSTWLHDEIMELSLVEETPVVTDIHPLNVFDPSFTCPKVYSTVGQYFKNFKAKGYLFNFDPKERINIFGADNIKHYEKQGRILIAITPDGNVMLVDNNNFLYTTEKNTLVPVDTLEEFLGIDSNEAPVEFAETKVYGKAIPVGLVLGYKFGLDRLMSLLGVIPRRVPIGQRTNIQPHEYAIVFSDETLVFNRDNVVAAMVLGGFRKYERSVKNYSVYTFDKPSVYLNVLEAYGVSARYLREIDLLDAMFVDPITLDLLKEMKEPLTYRGLLVRSCELLTNDQHPHALDMQYMRIKGYERFAGSVYTEMVNAIREHKGKSNKRIAGIELYPYAIWKRITQDPSVGLVNDINPIQQLKEQEAVTFSGTGGRGSRSMTRETREFHQNDMGIISEATTDSSDVAINTFLSANPKLVSLRGTAAPYDKTNTSLTSILSTSALLAVGSTNDDPKRTNFINIQNSHAVACNGYKAPTVRTGYEQVMVHRVGEGFASTAKQDGIVTSVTDTGIKIQYKDGTEQGFEIGRRFGASAGLVMAHQMRSDVEQGQKFKQGDVLVYNEGFFQRDILNPSSIVFKTSLTTTVALLESRQTHEDASAISKELASQLSTKITKTKDIIVSFNQSVRGLVQIGQTVKHDTVLCYIEDETTAKSKLFDETSLNTLRLLSSQSPTAKVNGTIERIEVYYLGDLQDMTESLFEVTKASDRDFASRARSQGKPVYSGQVTEAFRVNGEPLDMDSLCIRVYITSDVPAGIGDKGVFANQMKTVFSEILENKVTTENGQEVHAIFGAQSIFNRIVNSPFIIGTTNVVLDLVGKKAVRIYNGEKA